MYAYPHQLHIKLFCMYVVDKAYMAAMSCTRTFVIDPAIYVHIYVLEVNSPDQTMQQGPLQHYHSNECPTLQHTVSTTVHRTRKLNVIVQFVGRTVAVYINW